MCQKRRRRGCAESPAVTEKGEGVNIHGRAVSAPRLSAGSCHSIDLSYMTFTSNGRLASPQSLMGVGGGGCPFSHPLDVGSSRRRQRADLIRPPFIIMCTRQDIEPSELLIFATVSDIREFLCSPGRKV